MILIFLILNFGISWLNAWGVGKTWDESKAEGGFEHFVTWCAAIMSGCGFTWCYLVVLAFVAETVPYKGHPLLTHHAADVMFELGYLVIILPVIGSGIGITISSWRDFKRNRSLATGGVAAYNTFAQIYNTAEAIRYVPSIFKDVREFMKTDDDEESPMQLIIILLVVLAVAGGFLTTVAIVRSSARAKLYDVRERVNAARLQNAG